MKKYFLIPILLLIGLVAQAQTHWHAVDPPGSSGLSATITGIIEIDGIEQFNDQLEIGVFQGDECRGVAMSSYLVLDRYMVFLTVYGLEGEEDIFRIYDHSIEMELDVTCLQTFIYHNDESLGTIFEPYVFGFQTNQPSQFEITVTAQPEEGGRVTGGGIYALGDICNLEADPNTGYAFVHWSREGEIVSTTTSYSFIVDENGSYQALFEQVSYVIEAKADPEDGGEIIGGGTYPYGESVTLTATATEGYRFVNWTEDDVFVSEDEAISFIALSDRRLVAHFQSTVGVEETEWPEVSVYPNPVTDKLYIETHCQSSRCEIYSITGALVYSRDDCAEQFEINVSDYAAGSYVIHLISDNSVQTRSFIKK